MPLFSVHCTFKLLRILLSAETDSHFVFSSLQAVRGDKHRPPAWGLDFISFLGLWFSLANIHGILTHGISGLWAWNNMTDTKVKCPGFTAVVKCYKPAWALADRVSAGAGNQQSLLWCFPAASGTIVKPKGFKIEETVHSFPTWNAHRP